MHSSRWMIVTLAFAATFLIQLKAAADEVCLCAAEATTNYGHRGFGNSSSDNAYAENTLPSIEHALTFTDAVEIDVMLTDDGHLLVTHDPTLDRLTDQEGCALSRPIDELREIDAGGPYLLGKGFRFSVLDELLETLDLGLLNIELKIVSEDAETPCNPTDREKLLDLLIPLLDDYDGRAEFVVTSFDFEVLAMLRERAPQYRIGFLSNVPDDMTRAAEAGFEAINLSILFLLDPAASISEAHQLGLEVNVWTVDDPIIMRELIDAGADGIITNRPDTLKTLTEEYCAEEAAPVRCFEEESSGGCSATGEAPGTFALLAFALIFATLPRHYVALRGRDR